MNIDRLKKRLAELEQSAPKSLIIRVTLKDGSHIDMTVKELIEKCDQLNTPDYWCFKVVEGNNLKDLKEFLDWIAPSVIE